MHATNPELAACAPKMLDEALVCLDTKLHATDKAALLSTPYDRLIGYHYTLGRWIRNNWQSPDLMSDVNGPGFHDREGMSMWIIQLYWLENHGCMDARRQRAAFGTAFGAEADRSAANSPEGMMRIEDIKVQPPHFDCTTSAEANAQ